MPLNDYIPGVCVGIGENCTDNGGCYEPGVSCISGKCQLLECNINSAREGKDSFKYNCTYKLFVVRKHIFMIA